MDIRVERSSRARPVIGVIDHMAVVAKPQPGLTAHKVIGVADIGPGRGTGDADGAIGPARLLQLSHLSSQRVISIKQPVAPPGPLAPQIWEYYWQNARPRR